MKKPKTIHQHPTLHMMHSMNNKHMTYRHEKRQDFILAHDRTDDPQTKIGSTDILTRRPPNRAADPQQADALNRVDAVNVEATDQ